MEVLRAFFGLLMAAIVTGQIVEITPKDSVVVRVGAELNVSCKVPYKLDSCRMTIGSRSYILSPNQPGDTISYQGAGLEAGECGALLRHVEENMNGNISCILPPPSGNIEVSASVRLIVARAPAEPILVDLGQNKYKETDVYHARCDVENGRPAAKIHWSLDDIPLDSRTIHQATQTPVPNSDLTSVSQNVSIVLTPDYNGKFLTCSAEHEGLDQPSRTTRQIIVEYAPKHLEPSDTITIFGLKLGSEGRLNVSVRANPLPSVEWTIGAIRLREREMSEEGLRALEPIAVGNGWYNITLVLEQVRKEDVEKEYKLKVSNHLGDVKFTVRISTMDEPAGVELSTGAIVGIVIAVLVLLAAISLVVFAKATDKWCFGGGSHDNKNSGESTPAGDVLIESGIPLAARPDTESAGGGRGGRKVGRLAELGARVRAVLPKGRDKVAAEAANDNDDKPLSDEKKGVVYAELALGEQAQGDKPPPPATEYAEIVYTDQNQPKQTKE